jgi:hypothetical protein
VGNRLTSAFEQIERTVVMVKAGEILGQVVTVVAALALVTVRMIVVVLISALVKVLVGVLNYELLRNFKMEYPLLKPKSLFESCGRAATRSTRKQKRAIE